MKEKKEADWDRFFRILRDEDFLASRLDTGLLLVTWVAIQTVIIGFRRWRRNIWWVTFVTATVLAARLVGLRVNADTPAHPVQRSQTVRA